MTSHHKGTPILRSLGGSLALACLALLPSQTPRLQQLAGKLELRSSAPSVYVGQRFALIFHIGIRRDLYPGKLVQPFRRRLDLPIQIKAPWLQSTPSLRLLPPEGSTQKPSLSFILGTRIAKAHPLPTSPNSPFTWFEAQLPVQAQTPGPLRLSNTRLLLIHASSFRHDFIKGPIPQNPKKETLLAPSLPLQIQPLPPRGTPIPFSGAVGKFSVHAVLGEIRRPKKTIRLHLNIQGNGDLSPIKPPKLQDIPAFKNFHVFGWIKSQGQSALTFTYDLIPTGKKPTTTIPAIPFVFFDPSPPARYRTIQTRPISIPDAIKTKPISQAPSAPSKPSQALSPKTLLALLTLAQGLLLMAVLLFGPRASALRWTLTALLLASLIPEASLLPAALTPKPQQVLILQDGCPLLRAPHTDLPALRKLRRGSLFQLIEGSDHWLRIRDAGGEGWVSRLAGRIQ